MTDAHYPAIIRMTHKGSPRGTRLETTSTSTKGLLNIHLIRAKIEDMKHKGTCDTYCGHRLTIAHCDNTENNRAILDKDPRVVTYYSDYGNLDQIEFVYAFDRKIGKSQLAKSKGIKELQ